VVDYTLNLQMGDMSYSELRRLEMSFIRIGSYLNRIFPNSPASKIITDLERMIMLARTAQVAIHAVELASGPIGWLFAATAIVGAGFAASDFMTNMG
jgi:hypothetical protein